MTLGIISKIFSESLTSLYPVFVKNIGLPVEIQLWSRCFTYVFISFMFINYRTILENVFSKMGMLLSMITMIHIYTSYQGFVHLESGTAYTLFYLYPLFIILLSGKFNPLILVAMGGVLLLTDSFVVNGYGVMMILFAALTEALIYFVVRRIHTSNWNHIFISYCWGAIGLTLYYWNQLQLKDSVLTVSVLINGIIGVLGYWLRFYSMGQLTPLVYALLSYVGIVMSFVYGWWFNQEQITLSKLIGVICILIPNLYQLIQ
jgi:drug/metabolite transporter (DMT)-like permease